MNLPITDKVHAIAFNHPASQGVIGFFSDSRIEELEAIFQLSFWDIGDSVSKLIQGRLHSRHLYLDVQEFLAEVPDTSHAVVSSSGNSVLLLSNLPILLEPDLAFDLNHWLERLSSNHLVIVELSAFKQRGNQMVLTGPGPTTSFSIDNIPILAMEQRV